MLGEITKKARSFIGAVFLAFVALLCSCVERHNAAVDDNYDAAEDSAWVCSVVESIVNPEFSKVVDVLQFKENVRQSYLVDSIFLSMPDEVLKNVANVAIRKYGTATKLSIVSEYLQSPEIYNLLPPQQEQATSPDPPKEVDKEATDLGDKPGEEVVNETQSYRIDTIDGKQVVVKVTKRESYTK